MKLLLDQGLPLSAAALLRDVGIDTIHVGEIALSAAEDAEIIQKAREEERVIVTHSFYLRLIQLLFLPRR
ncbi:DUF5615 family PIN-like protein [Aerosakkonemataceae cyanobacterium BLCC-F50]|uniref:DUF5615 family PIN-like protein n=1 Tax=Floridaenema flaviceps BLCC-F50 TaxID=3153642 RepID=A0ABV4Y0K8_9CYAN